MQKYLKHDLKVGKNDFYMKSEKVTGIKLTPEKQVPCSVAILEEKLETFSTTEDQEIIENIAKEQPSVVAFTNPHIRREEKGFREDEEELVDKGHSFLPPSMFDNNLIERTVFIKKSIQQQYQPKFIETRPEVSSDILGIEDDRDLEMLGIDTESIESMGEFEAVIAALTARMYTENDYENKGFIIPKKPGS